MADWGETAIARGLGQTTHSPGNSRLAVVLLNWNAAQETTRCIRAISAWEHLRPTLWVVDNASTDGSAEHIASAFPGVHLLRNRINLGFAGGNNRGIEQALQDGSRLLLLLNNDASVSEADVACLTMSLHAEPSFGCVGPLLFTPGAMPRLLSAGGRDISRFVDTHLHRLPSRGTTYTVRYVPGTAVLIRADVFRAVGLFDEAYFFSGEMADLCERARAGGYLCAIDTRARAYHDQHASSKLRRTLYAYYSLRNRFLFVAKFRRQHRLLLDGLWALYGLGMALKAAVSRQPARARAMSLAVRDGLRGRYGDQNARVLAGCRPLRHPTDV